MKAVKLLSQLVYYSLVLVLVLIILLFMGSKLPLPSNYQLKNVMSGSMEPNIKMGSMVVIKPSEQYRIGEVISFGRVDKDEIPITHRIVEIEGSLDNPVFTTKGDANESPDPQRIRQDEVMGKVLFSLPYFGYAVDFVRKPIGFFLVIIMPALIIIGDELRKIWRELRRTKL